MKLSLDQLARVKKVIEANAITLDTLRDDLIDHLCCVVEIEITRGSDFETALREAIEDLAPEGLDKIQSETVFLLNSTKIISMKRIMYTIGLVSGSASSMGICFKLLHLQGADPLLTYGLLAFTLLFLPLLIFDRFKTNLRGMLSEKLKLSLALISALLTGLAIALRLFHINATQVDMLFVVGAAIFSFGFLPFLFFTMYKKSIS